MTKEKNHLNKKENLPQINSHSDIVNELMGRKPSFILKHGISIVFCLLIIFFVSTKYIPYSDSININAFLYPDCRTAKIISPKDGNLQYIFSGLEKKVNEKDTLAILISSEMMKIQPDTIVVQSPFNGVAYKTNDYNVGDMVNKEELLMMVYNSYTPEESIIAKSYVEEDIIHKIRKGMNMTLETEPNSRFIISSVSLMPGKDGLYTIIYERKGDNLGKKHSFIYGKKVTANIAVDSISIYSRFFEDGIFSNIRLK